MSAESAHGTGSRPSSPVVKVPGRIDVRRAFDVYVWGRSRTLGPDAKQAAVDDAPDGSDGALGVAIPPPEGARRSVSVPEELSFERGAGVWRSRADGGGRESA